MTNTPKPQPAWGKTEYPYIDVCKFIAALLIVSMHIDFGGHPWTEAVKHYIARLGVPYFFTASGFFLAKKLRGGPAESAVLSGYLKRILTLFCFWSLLYAPYHLFILSRSTGDVWEALFVYVRQLAFLAPSFMWYLMAAAVAAVPFCLLYKKRFPLLCGAAGILYLFGTLGNSYLNLVNSEVFRHYLDIFLTTRNGVFFGLPFFCLGGVCALYEYKPPSYKRLIPALAAVYGVFCAEVYWVRGSVPFAQDCSMYLAMPAVVYCVFRLTMPARKQEKTGAMPAFLRKASVGIYCSQFGFILIYGLILKAVGLGGLAGGLLLYCLTVISGICLTILFIHSGKQRLSRLL